MPKKTTTSPKPKSISLVNTEIIVTQTQDKSAETTNNPPTKNTKKRQRDTSEDHVDSNPVKQVKKDEDTCPSNAFWQNYTLEKVEEKMKVNMKAYQPSSKEDHTKMWYERILQFMREDIGKALDAAETSPNPRRAACDYFSIASGHIHFYYMVGYNNYQWHNVPVRDPMDHTGFAAPNDKHFEAIRAEMRHVGLDLEWKSILYDPNECGGWFWDFNVYRYTEGRKVQLEDKTPRGVVIIKP